MTAALAAHLREVWSYDGLEVTAASATAVTAALGPTFPIGELCVDVCDPTSFDAVVELVHGYAATVLTITPTRTPDPPARGSTMAWVLVAVLVAVLWAAAQQAGLGLALARALEAGSASQI